ncbi:hypothetical protein FACS1894179_05620 [Bacteroidia bacterium]|nr:hypothetical protein FACS1894179_05620 [Bacteroidia bacterium]
MQVFKQHNEDFKKMLDAGLRSNSTYQKYKDVYLHLEAFIKKRYNRPDIALIELTPAFITDFELYLATVPKPAHLCDGNLPDQRRTHRITQQDDGAQEHPGHLEIIYLSDFQKAEIKKDYPFGQSPASIT